MTGGAPQAETPKPDDLERQADDIGEAADALEDQLPVQQNEEGVGPVTGVVP
ncbi:hypothetical protein [Brevundimonas balnearis]|uniref:Uncharacterized protein n=1 Tax=Brevundimonas balnearis TaxID=1572858 RepID=A0ABV6R3Y3_9CAUL